MIRSAQRWLLANEPFVVLPIALVVALGRWWVLLPALAVPLLWLLRWRASGALYRPSATRGAIAALLFGAGLSLLAVVDWDLALPRLAALLAGLGLALAVHTWAVDGRRVLWAACALTVVGGALALASPFVAEWPTYKTPVLPLLADVYSRFQLAGGGYVAGTARGGIHINQLAGIAAAVAPLGVSMLVVVGGRMRVVVAVAVLCLLSMLLVSQSRSGYMGVFAGLVVVGAGLLAALPPSRRGAWLAPAGALAAAAAGSLLWLSARWVAAADMALDSLAGRQELWNRGALMVADFPWTGVGMGHFSRTLHALYFPFITAPTEFVPHAHNVPLQVALDIGLIGLAGAAALAGVALVRALVVGFRGSGASRACALGAAAGLVGFAVYGLTDAIAIGARGALPVWALLGVALAAADSRS